MPNEAERMKLAVHAVLELKLSQRAAAKKYEIPETTLRRYVNKACNASDDKKLTLKFEPNYQIRQVLTDELEQQLHTII